jgi:hypothetical protein
MQFHFLEVFQRKEWIKSFKGGKGNENAKISKFDSSNTYHWILWIL